MSAMHCRSEYFLRYAPTANQGGAKFQAIDLRWGISETVANHHQTVRICLQEIQRSQRLSPRPNSIALLGDPGAD